MSLSSDNISILVADDDTIIVETLTSALKRLGFKTTPAFDGQEALSLYEEEAFDIVITDLQMPKMDGMELLKTIKQKNEEAIVLVITGYGTIRSAVEAVKAGAFDFIPKPFQLDELEIVLNKALKAKELFKSIIAENKAYMEAYDWLAKTLEELGSEEEAQKILLSATEISPKAILRHKAIANISLKRNDLDTAEQAFKSAINIGKHSCFKTASDYTGLAKVHVKKDSSQDALSILSTARNEFENDRNALLETSISEGMTYKAMNKDEKAKKALDKASKIFNSLTDVPAEVIMDMSRVCFELGEKEKGLELIQGVVRNNHDNKKVLDKVENLFKDADMEQEGAKVIASTKSEIVKLNNEGVKLVQQEKLDEAVTYFEKAAKGLPGNKIINGNAAQALLMHIQKTGKNDEDLNKVSQYLERLRKIDPSDETYKELLNVYESISVAAVEEKEEEKEEKEEVKKWEIP